MKSLAQLNNVERAKLLFDLFPCEVPDFLAFQKAITENLLRDPDQLKDKWENQFITMDCWLRLANKVDLVLKKYENRLNKSSRLFADQLFDGYTALYSAHCLQQHVKHKKTEPKFKAAVEMFFI